MKKAILSGAVFALAVGFDAHAQHTLDPFEYVYTAGQAVAVAIADLTGDGQNELLVATGQSFDPIERTRLKIYRFDPLINTFVQVADTPFPNVTTRVAMIAADVNGDGVAEAIIGTGGTLTVVNWDGQTIRSRTHSSPIAIDVLAALELDGDPRAAIVGQSWSSGGVLYRADASGELALVRNMFTGVFGRNDAAVGDLDSDGLPDLALMSGSPAFGPHVEIHHSSGYGDFRTDTAAIRLPDTGILGGLGVGDLNGDGRDDIVFGRWRNTPTTLYVLTQQPGAVFDVAEVPVYDIPTDIAVADLSGDGRNEVVVAHTGWRALSLFRTSDAGLHSPERHVLPYGNYAAHALATGDITGDGCPDVAVAGSEAVVLRGVDCQVGPPPQADLAVWAGVSGSQAHVSAFSLATSTVPATDVVLEVRFELTNASRVYGPSNCDRTGTVSFVCRWPSIDVAGAVGWPFTVDAPKKHAVVVHATVSAATPDPDLSNNVTRVAR